MTAAAEIRAEAVASNPTSPVPASSPKFIPVDGIDATAPRPKRLDGSTVASRQLTDNRRASTGSVDERAGEVDGPRAGASLGRRMLAQTRDSDIEAIYAIAKTPVPDRPEQVEILKLAPAFILNELRVAFTIGFVILLPFLLIDLVVASILLALGMMMVPPATISLPIKILMFVLIDGWSLILQGVLGSFR